MNGVGGDSRPKPTEVETLVKKLERATDELRSSNAIARRSRLASSNFSLAIATVILALATIKISIDNNEASKLGQDYLIKANELIQLLDDSIELSKRDLDLELQKYLVQITERMSDIEVLLLLPGASPMRVELGESFELLLEGASYVEFSVGNPTGMDFGELFLELNFSEEIDVQCPRKGFDSKLKVNRVRVDFYECRDFSVLSVLGSAKASLSIFGEFGKS